MEAPIRFIVPCVPIAQPRPRAFVLNGKARVYAAPRAHAVTTFKATVRLAAQSVYTGPPLTEPISLGLLFLMPRPSRLRWKKRGMPRCWHLSKPDCDNLYKSTVDALTGILWRDDSQIVDLRLCKLYAAGDEPPGVKVEIMTLAEDDVSNYMELETSEVAYE